MKYKITIFNNETYKKRNMIIKFRFDGTNHCWWYEIKDFIGTIYERTGTEQSCFRNPVDEINRLVNNIYTRKNEYVNLKKVSA